MTQVPQISFKGRHHALVGPPEQVAGGVFVADTVSKCEKLLRVLLARERPVGFDTETVGVNPKKQTPAARHGRIACWSVAWFPNASEPSLGWHPRHPQIVPLAHRAFIPAWPGFERLLDIFRPWLESPDHPKVAHNAYTFDRHVFANHGIAVNGIIGDSLNMSRLLSAKEKQRHGLKELCDRELGYVMRDFKTLFSRPTARVADPYKKLTTRRKSNISSKEGNPLIHDAYPEEYDLTTCPGERWEVSFKTHTQVPLDRIATEWPAKLPDLIDYASLDAKCHLELWALLHHRLQATPARQGRSLVDVDRIVLNPVSYVLNSMERTGVLIDQEAAAQASAKCHRMAHDTLLDMNQFLRSRQLADPGEFNWGSSKQLVQLFYGGGPDLPEVPNPSVVAGVSVFGLGLEVPTYCGSGTAVKRVRRDKESNLPEKYPTDEIATQNLIKTLKRKGDLEASDVLSKLLQYKKALKMAKYPDEHLNEDKAGPTGRIHAKISASTETGRLSISLPPLQQIPSGNDVYGIRKAFVARPGHKLVVCDYTALELYVLAHIIKKLANDDGLEQDLYSGDGHGATAIRCWPDRLVGIKSTEIKNHPDPKVRELRKTAKAIGLAINYGKGAYGLGDSLGVTPEEAQGIIDNYFAAYPGVAYYHEYIKRFAASNGYVPTLLGRRRPLLKARIPECKKKWKDRTEEDKAREGARKGALRQALNTPIQGTAADIVSCAMLRCYTGSSPDLRRVGYFDEYLASLGARMLLQIHDELIFEVPEGTAEEALKVVRNNMENPFDHPNLDWVDLCVKLKVEGSVCDNWSEGK